MFHILRYFILREQLRRFVPNFFGEFLRNFIFLSNPGLPFLDFLLFFLNPLIPPLHLYFVFALLLLESHYFLCLCELLRDKELLEQIEVTLVGVAAYRLHLLDFCDLAFYFFGLALYSLQLSFQLFLLFLQFLFLFFIQIMIKFHSSFILFLYLHKFLLKFSILISNTLFFLIEFLNFKFIFFSNLLQLSL
jgi:hypothetical protein